MFKNLVIFSVGAVVGAAVVVNELVNRRLTVETLEDGTVILNHPHAHLRHSPSGD